MNTKQKHTDTTLPLIVVGGGIGGCATALMLARHGIEVVLLEQADELGEIGAGIQLGPNAFRMFDVLGITAEVTKTVVYPEHLSMIDGITGEPVTRMRLGAPFEARFGKPYGVIYRADLHAVLVEACRRHSGIRLLTGQKLVRYEDNGKDVLVETESQETYRGAGLIGCDGLWSKVRAQMLGDGKPRVSGHIAYRAVLPTAEVPSALRLNDMTLWAGPRNHLVQYPLRCGELTNLVAVFHSDRYVEGWDAKADLDELQARFSNACPQVKALLGKIDTWRMWVLCDRDPVRTWSDGRVTLLGDAAHPMLQYMAQGAAMAMEDAVTIAYHVAKAPSLSEAFMRYQDERYLRCGRVQLTARLYGEVYHSSGVAAEVRNQMLRGRSEAQGYDSLAWLYDVPTEGALAAMCSAESTMEVA